MHIVRVVFEMMKLFNKRRDFLLGLIVSTVTVIAYLSALRNEFVLWDDDDYIFENHHVQQFNWDMIKWAFSSFVQGHWHPLTSISHAIDCAIWGLNASGHHLTNIILHAINSLLVVIIIYKLLNIATECYLDKNNIIPPNSTKVFIAAGVAGILFGIHPLHVESVAWASDRKDVLCALFYLLSSYYYLKYITTSETLDNYKHCIRNTRYLISLCFFVFSLLSKSMAVSLPVVMIILDYYPFRRITSIKTLLHSMVEKGLFFLFTILISGISMFAMGKEQTIQNAPPYLRPLVASRAIIEYLRKTILPRDLSPYYPYPNAHDISLSSSSYLIPVIITVVVSGYVVLNIFASARQRIIKRLVGISIGSRGWQSAWLCYVVMLLPVLGIIENGSQSMADRYFYLPSIGPFCLVGIVSARVWEKTHKSFLLRGLATVFATLVSVALLWITYNQIQIWRNSIVFWSYIISREPMAHAMAYSNRGIAYKFRGDIDKALSDLDHVIALQPQNGYAYNNRGVTLLEKGEVGKALLDFNRALNLNPKGKDFHLNRGIALKSSGKSDEAKNDFSREIDLNPDNYKPYFYLGLLFHEAGELDKAMAQLNMAITKNPLDSFSYNNIGLIMMEKRDFDKAIFSFDQAIALSPNFIDAYFNRGMLFKNKGEPEKAMLDFDRVIALNPTMSEAYNNRGVIWKNMGEFERAIKDFNQAIALKPENADAYNNRGVAFDELGQVDTAIKNYDRAISLNPRLVSALNNRGLALRKQGFLNQAVEYFTKAINIAPSSHLSRLNRAMTLRELGQLHSAIEDYGYILGINPNMDIAYWERGVTYEQMHKASLAERDYEKACNLGYQDGCRALQEMRH